jgi:rsbT co-antagonist protein RsbR
MTVTVDEETLAPLRAELAAAHRRIFELEQSEQELRIQQDELLGALSALSTPLIPISESVVVMPLIGLLSERRLEQVIETLLTGISKNHARVAILDITGMSELDSQVAIGIVNAARAAQLIGAEVILTGISPEVARALVALDVDLGSIVTQGALQDGIAFAMTRPFAANRRP